MTWLSTFIVHAWEGTDAEKPDRDGSSFLNYTTVCPGSLHLNTWVRSEEHESRSVSPRWTIEKHGEDYYGSSTRIRLADLWNIHIL